MIVVSLNIKDEVYDKVMYLLNSLPKQNIQIIEKRVIKEINPTTLPKEHFDYMSKEELDAMETEIEKVKNGNLSNFVDFEELKNELQN